MASKSNKKPQNTSAPGKPETPAEVSAAEAAPGASQAETPTEAGDIAMSETGAFPLPGADASGEDAEQNTQDSSATVKPEIRAEESAKEAEKSVSQAVTQAATGNAAVSEAEASPLPGGEHFALILGQRRELSQEELKELSIGTIMPAQPPVEFIPGNAGQGEAVGTFVSHIIVTAKKEGFRRAGRAWSKTPTTVDMDDLTEAQIDALVLEPMLDVAFLAE